MANDTRYWFPAKKFGWGWGPPTAWQGWVVLLASMLVMIGAAIHLLPNRPVGFVLVTLLTVVVLVIICYLKGEAPGWRWGNDR